MQLGLVVPVKPHIQKFLIRRYGDGSSHQIAVRQRTYLGNLVALSLTKNPLLNLTAEPVKGCHVVFYYSTDTKLLEIPPRKLKLLADALERNFRDCLVNFVMGYHYATGDQMQAVKKFLIEHQIDEDDLSADTAWKIWRDFEGQIERNRQKIFRSSVGDSPVFVGNPAVSSAFSAV